LHGVSYRLRDDGDGADPRHPRQRGEFQIEPPVGHVHEEGVVEGVVGSHAGEDVQRIVDHRPLGGHLHDVDAVPARLGVGEPQRHGVGAVLDVEHVTEGIGRSVEGLVEERVLRPPDRRAVEEIHAPVPSPLAPGVGPIGLEEDAPVGE
jgi:hypothetical protein